MANYSISDTTLTALGDAVRSKAGETRTEYTSTVSVESEVIKQAGAWAGTETYIWNVSNVYSAKLKLTKSEIISNDDMKLTYRYYTNDFDKSTFTFDENGEFIINSLPGQLKIGIEFRNNSNRNSVDIFRFEIEATCYSEENLSGEVIKTPYEVKNTMTPMQMVEKINGLDSVPEEALNITGACNYKFAYGGWDWFINNFGSKITTSDIGSAINMFSETTVETIPFELNFDSKSTSHNLSYIFFDTENLKEIPKINNAIPGDMNNFISKCLSIRYLPEDIGDWFDWSYMEKQTSTYNASKAQMFGSCYSLRKVPMGLLNRANPNIGNSYSYFYYAFQSCYSLDELVGLPIPYTAEWTSNAFYNTFNYCCRLKELTFALQEDGTPIKVNWKNQKIDLGANRSVGYMSSSSYKSYVLNYNSGITADKEVVDDATYQALKDDPDWFVSTKPAYARYNKQSAINTLNSLPDASEYLATAGGTNTIILPKGVGGSTDGGDPYDLTEEEIAVATAKGWTVSFY